MSSQFDWDTVRYGEKFGETAIYVAYSNKQRMLEKMDA